MKQLHEFPNTVLAKMPLTVYVWLQKDGGVTVIARTPRETFAESLDPIHAVNSLQAAVAGVRNSVSRDMNRQLGSVAMPCIVRSEAEINP